MSHSRNVPSPGSLVNNLLHHSVKTEAHSNQALDGRESKRVNQLKMSLQYNNNGLILRDEAIGVMNPPTTNQQQTSTLGLAPSYLPPLSPASSVSSALHSSVHSNTKSIVPKRKSSKRRQRPSNDKPPRSPTESLPDQSLEDPCPDHLNVAADSDDLSNLSDFSLVSFRDKSSPRAVQDFSMPKASTSNKRSHRRAKSWDSSDSYQDSSSKTCLPVPALFRRTKPKVMCADVASVSNASDTLVSVDNGPISGREVHEAAKTALNAGRYDQAVNMFEAILAAQVKRFGDEHASVGAAMHNVGVVRLRMEQHQRAEANLCRAVTIRRKVLGSDHLELAASLSKLGSARVVLQKFDEALHNLREALRITRNALGRNHKTVAQTLCHIACLYFEAGELFSAQATFEDALEIYRDVFHTETDRDACMAHMTEALCNIGSIRNKRKNFEGAIECFKEALDLQRGIMGLNHPRVIATLDNLGYSYSKMKAYNQALTCYKEMLTAQMSRKGSFNSECFVTLKKQILIFEKLKNLDGAVKVTKKVLDDLRRDRLCMDDPILVETEKILSELTLKREKRTLGAF